MVVKARKGNPEATNPVSKPITRIQKIRIMPLIRVETSSLVETICPLCFSAGQIRALRSRRALLITETELKLIAAAAIIGDSSKPKNG